jgi:hypothetical protein
MTTEIRPAAINITIPFVHDTSYGETNLEVATGTRVSVEGFTRDELERWIDNFSTLISILRDELYEGLIDASVPE